MWDLPLFGTNVYYIFCNFILYSFVGWIYESTLVSVRTKKFVNRGFLTGPVIPIYGSGATILLLTLRPLAGNYLAVFFGGFVMASVLEYVTSWVMEVFFHARWWDYSKHKFNLNGRIYLGASLLWGALSVLLLAVLKPLSDRLIDWIPQPAGHITATVIAVLFCTDLVSACIAAAHIDQKLAELEALRAELVQNLEKTRLYQTGAELHAQLSARMSELRLPEIGERLRACVETYRTETQDTVGHAALKAEIEAKLKTFNETYKQKLRPNFLHRRLLRAYPGFRPTRRGAAALEDLRQRLSHKAKQD